MIIIGCDACSMLLNVYLPAIRRAREEGRQERCVENLKQIGLAMRAYHQQYGCFPPAFVPDKNGKPQHSWRVLLLPLLDRQDLYARYRFDEPWNSANNAALARHMPRVYQCPSNPETSGTQTGYAMLVGPHAISDGPTPRRVSDIKDGLSNTILVAEAADAGIHWLEPRDLDTTKMVFRINPIATGANGGTCDEISSRHPDQANALFCDGSVRPLSSDSLTRKAVEARTTIDGDD
jgi:prepilin-type processing-associated H-X9-DG protein